MYNNCSPDSTEGNVVGRSVVGTESSGKTRMSSSTPSSLWVDIPGSKILADLVTPRGGGEVFVDLRILKPENALRWASPLDWA